MILEWLQEADLQCDIKKCKFHVIKIMYLSLIVFYDDIKMNSVKIKVIVDWESSQNIHDVQAFLEFVNFYWWFIWHFSKIVWFLVNLTKKIMKFLWNIICKYAFNDLKKWFITVSILAHFNSDLECVLEADLSDHAQKDVLSQYDKNDVLHSIIFFSQKLNAVKSNYEIYDKELLTIIRCFEQWQLKLEEFMFSVNILTDHKNLQYFMITKQLMHQQTWWAEYLSWFDFKITY